MDSRHSSILGRLAGRRTRALAVAGALTVAGIGGTVAVINAQSPTPTPSPSGSPAASPSPARQAAQQRADEYLSRLAQNLGVTADRLRAALQQTALQEVDAALQRGDITAQQAQQARERINAGDVGGFGFRFGGPGGHRGGGGHVGASHEQIAQFLGITAEQLRTELNGRSLAQVAQAHNRTRDALIQFLVTAARQQIAAEVQAGRLTQQQADQRIAELQTRIAQKVDEVHQTGQRRMPGAPRTP